MFPKIPQDVLCFHRYCYKCMWIENTICLFANQSIILPRCAQYEAVTISTLFYLYIQIYCLLLSWPELQCVQDFTVWMSLGFTSYIVTGYTYLCAAAITSCGSNIIVCVLFVYAVPNYCINVVQCTVCMSCMYTCHTFEGCLSAQGLCGDYYRRGWVQSGWGSHTHIQGTHPDGCETSSGSSAEKTWRKRKQHGSHIHCDICPVNLHRCVATKHQHGKVMSATGWRHVQVHRTMI